MNWVWRRRGLCREVVSYAFWIFRCWLRMKFSISLSKAVVLSWENCSAMLTRRCPWLSFPAYFLTPRSLIFKTRVLRPITARYSRRTWRTWQLLSKARWASLLMVGLSGSESSHRTETSRKTQDPLERFWFALESLGSLSWPSQFVATMTPDRKMKEWMNPVCFCYIVLIISHHFHKILLQILKNNLFCFESFSGKVISCFFLKCGFIQRRTYRLAN